MANGTRRVRAYLKAQKRSQGWLARELGVTPACISQIMTGDRTPSLTLASKLEALTGVPAREFAKVA